MINDFTDDQYLKLINNTIIRDTNYGIDEFTGGNVQLTCNGGKDCKLIRYTVNLLFGYKNNNSRKCTIDIKEDLTDIWFKSIQLKMKSKQINNNGSDFKDLSMLMNSDLCSTISDKQLDVNVKTVNVSGSVIVKKKYDHITNDSTMTSNTIVQTTTTTITETMRNYFVSKNLKNDLDTEFQKFLLFKNNKNNLKDRELNWMRWVDKISNNPIKIDYAWQFKKLKTNSEEIEKQIFIQTGKIAPSFSEFQENPIDGLGVVQLEHPNFDKKVTIFYKKSGESEMIIKSINNNQYQLGA
ncbi:MAG: hypothetical protein U9N59_05210 [Campylobacterota bacterium]|nr:hypothetical protein [Campylobacterota bacterium]